MQNPRPINKVVCLGLKSVTGQELGGLRAIHGPNVVIKACESNFTTIDEVADYLKATATEALVYLVTPAVFAASEILEVQNQGCRHFGLLEYHRGEIHLVHVDICHSQIVWSAMVHARSAA